MFNFLADGAGSIFDKVNEFLNKYIDLGYNVFRNLTWWLKAIILVFLVILLVLGIIRFIAKSWKLLLILVILIGIGVAVYYIFIKGKSSAPENVLDMTRTMAQTATIFL